MGLFDKVKSIFTEEVEEEPEIKVEQIKKEVTHVPIESPSVKTEIKEEKKEENEPIAENNISNKNRAVFFSDSDFEDLAKPRHTEVVSQNHSDEFFSKEELARMYGSNSVKEKKEEPKDKIFKPTPIISPVYGVLDKNYHKEDIVERKEPEYKPKTSVNVDTIRNKAYGTLEEQLKDQVLYDKKQSNNDVDLFAELEKKKSAIKFDDELPKRNSNPEELTMDLTKELDNLLMKKQSVLNNLETREERNKNIEKKDDILDLMDDNMYDEGDE